jgi:hypothetical protein
VARGIHPCDVIAPLEPLPVLDRVRGELGEVAMGARGEVVVAGRQRHRAPVQRAQPDVDRRAPVVARAPPRIGDVVGIGDDLPLRPLD